MTRKYKPVSGKQSYGKGHSFDIKNPKNRSPYSKLNIITISRTENWHFCMGIAEPEGKYTLQNGIEFIFPHSPKFCVTWAKRENKICY